MCPDICPLCLYFLAVFTALVQITFAGSKLSNNILCLRRCLSFPLHVFFFNYYRKCPSSPSVFLQSVPSFQNSGMWFCSLWSLLTPYCPEDNIHSSPWHSQDFFFDSIGSLNVSNIFNHKLYKTKYHGHILISRKEEMAVGAVKINEVNFE